MPEGPSIVILREAAAAYPGKRIMRAEGNARIEMTRLIGQRIVALHSFGKQFLVELPDLALRIHLLMFGSYRVNERKAAPPRLSLGFRSGELNFYSCSVRIVEGRLDDQYDWRADAMSDAWDPRLARKKLRAMPGSLVCDALLDQTVFAGVGNIIKNEVLFRIRVHPLSNVGALPARKLHELVEQARQYSFEFLAWKKVFELRKHWLVHNRSVCPHDHVRFQRAYLGTTQRRSFFCERCQKLYQGT